MSGYVWKQTGHLAAHRLRVADVSEVMAVLGVHREDAAALVRQFRLFPDQRRAADLLGHCAAVLRERRDLMAPRHLESIQRAYAAAAGAK